MISVCVCVCVCVQSYLSVTPWTVAHQAPLSMAFSRQEYRRGWPFPSPGDLPDPGMEHTSLVSHMLEDGLFTTSASWETSKRVADHTTGLSVQLM